MGFSAQQPSRFVVLSALLALDPTRLFTDVEPIAWERRLIARDVAGQGDCAVQQGYVLAMRAQPLTLSGRRLEGTPPIGEELPMDLTATLTAVMAIMSFGFLAAVILGMI
jgi:hypothetical protein